MSSEPGGEVPNLGSEPEGDSSEFLDPEFRNRLAQLVGQESPYAWAGRMGIPKGTFERIWKKGAVPKVPHLRAIKSHTGVSLDWLLVGAGEAAATPPVVARPGAELGPEFVLVPRYDVRASAGGGTLVHSEQIVDYLAFKADWVRNRLGVPPGNLLLLEAVGDSMEPTISDGDLLLVNTHEPRIRDNAIYALNVNGDLMVKRVQKRLDGTLVVMSDNDRYSPEVVSPPQAEMLRVIGQVVWHGGLI